MIKVRLRAGEEGKLRPGGREFEFSRQWRMVGIFSKTGESSKIKDEGHD